MMIWKIIVLFEVQKKCKKQNPKICSEWKWKKMVLSKGGVPDSKMSWFINNQEAGGLLVRLVIKTPLTFKFLQ